jgi:tRNA (mo5U34)-methyltransferase
MAKGRRSGLWTPMLSAARFASMVRAGLRFRRKLDAIKEARPEIAWYPYDSFANLFQLSNLMKSCGMTLPSLAEGGPVLDLGAGDGALAFFLESLGHAVDAVDNAGANMNRMEGIRALAAALGSQVRIADIDIDAQFQLPRDYSLALMLGILYHLKNPYYALEHLAAHARYCFLSTRVACFTPDHGLRIEEQPVAYLLDRAETNNDDTNYWIFSPAGLERIVRRCGWEVMARSEAGAQLSDPVHETNDQRMFLLLRSAVLA